MWNKAFEILQKYSLATVKISPWSVLHLFKFPLVFPRKPLTSSIAMGKNLQHLPLLLFPVLHTSAATAPVGRAGCHSLLQKFSNQCWMVSLPPDWCKPFPDLSYSAILPLQVSVLPLSTCIDTEESGRHWNGDVVAPGNPAGLGEILALLQELGNLLLASRKRSARSHSAVLTQRRSISTRNKALQLWESPCFLLFKHPGPGWVRGPDLTCGHGEKLDSVPGWGLQPASPRVRCRSPQAPCVRGHPNFISVCNKWKSLLQQHYWSFSQASRDFSALWNLGPPP